MGLCSLNSMPARSWPNSKDTRRRKDYTWRPNYHYISIRKSISRGAGCTCSVTVAEVPETTTLHSSVSFLSSMEFGMKLPSFCKTRIPLCVRPYRCRLTFMTFYEIELDDHLAVVVASRKRGAEIACLEASGRLMSNEINDTCNKSQWGGFLTFYSREIRAQAIAALLHILHALGDFLPGLFVTMGLLTPIER